MNISSSQTAVQEAPQTSQNNDVQSAQNAEKNQQAQKEDKNKETKESKSDFKKLLEEPKDTDKLSLEQLAAQKNLNQLIDEEYANKFGFDTISGSKNLKSLFNYDTVKMSKDDAKFFVDMVENKQFALQQNGDKNNLIKFADEVGPTYKSQETSKVLTDLIAKAYNDQKPVRIDFDNKVSVILKVDAKGKVSAEFIPGDKAVEAYLKNNIGFLKQRFDDQNLPYNDLMYKQSNQNQNRERQNQKKDKGE